MAFASELKIRQILKNADIAQTFQCDNMSGMRRSRTIDTQIIVSDYIRHFSCFDLSLGYKGIDKNENR